jgi:hypothetical protein
MGRRRPASWRGEPHRDGVPRGLPGIGIVRSVEGSRQGIAGTMPCPARPGERQSGQIGELGEGGEKRRPAVRVARVVHGVGADKQIGGTDDLRVAQEQGQQDGVAGGDVGDRDSGRTGLVSVRDIDLVGQRRAADGSQIEGQIPGGSRRRGPRRPWTPPRARPGGAGRSRPSGSGSQSHPPEPWPGPWPSPARPTGESTPFSDRSSRHCASIPPSPPRHDPDRFVGPSALPWSDPAGFNPSRRLRTALAPRAARRW